MILEKTHNMTNWEKDKIKLNNIGVATIDNVNLEILNYLKTHIKNKKNLQKTNNTLAGHIKDEFDVPVTADFSKYISYSIANNNITNNYLQKINILSKDAPLYLHSLWMNFQKKYEFNPLHDHSGVFSFIIFMQIPYNLKEELKVFPNANGNYTSCLSFIYSDVNGSISDLPCYVDESYLEKMLLFPAKQKHLVYPFYTSNKERITVSGNVKFLI